MDRAGPDVRLVKLLEVTVTEGSGIVPDPVRRVTYYFRPDGEMVAYRDRWEEEERGKPTKDPAG